MVKRPFVLIQVLILLSALFFILIPGDSKGAQPVATINLDDAEQAADVGPGETGIVKFTGTVQAELVGPGQNIQMVVVNLEAEAGNWSTTISPSTLHFPAGSSEAKPFEVVVRVPNFTSSSVTQELVVSGQMSTVPGLPLLHNIQSTTGVISVHPYTIISLSCNESEKEGLRGESLFYEMKIRNEGNSYSQVSMTIDDHDGLEDDDWALDGAVEEITIGEGKEETVIVSATIPNRATYATYQFSIDATSDVGTNDTDSAEYTLFVDVVREKKVDDDDDIDDDDIDDDDDNGTGEDEERDKLVPDDSLKIGFIRIEPDSPYPMSDVKVFASISSNYRIISVKVNYWLTDEVPISIEMKRLGRDYYSTIGRFQDGQKVFFNITAEDIAGNIAGSNERAFEVGVEVRETEKESESAPGFGLPLSIFVTLLMALLTWKRSQSSGS